MTRALVKARERQFATEAAIHLGVNWVIGPDREEPDFLVQENELNFGLEVTQIFMGLIGQAGSNLKRAESARQKLIRRYQASYDGQSASRLTVKILGNLTEANLEILTEALLLVDFDARPTAYQVRMDLRSAHDASIGVIAYVTKGFRSDWFSMDDRVEWVDQSPLAIISRSVQEKSGKLPKYRSSVGNDVRLLLVADHFYNSGKVMKISDQPIDLFGFSIAYFYAYPEGVAVFTQRS